MSVRKLLLLGALLVSCGGSGVSDASVPDSALPDAGVEVAFSMRIFECPAGANLANVPVDVRALANPTTPLTNATSDASGLVEFRLVPPGGRLFLHGELPGYRDANFFPDDFIQADPSVLRPGSMCLTPRALVDQFFADTALAAAAGTGIVIIKMLDPMLARVPGTVTVSPPGVIVYGVAPDDAWDTSAEMSDSGIAYVANVPEGAISVTATSGTETLVADAWSFDDAIIGVNFRFGL